jgi:hypothetical protein
VIDVDSPLQIVKVTGVKLIVGVVLTVTVLLAGEAEKHPLGLK